MTPPRKYSKFDARAKTRRHIASCNVRTLAASLFVAAMLPIAGWSVEPTWVYESHPDPFHPGTAIHLASIELPGMQMTVRCASSTRMSEVRVYLGSELIAGMSAVAWKFDDRREQREKWQASTNRRSIVVPPRLQEDFVSNLRARQQLSISVMKGEDPLAELQIPLSGSSVVLTKALAACR